MDNVTIYDSFLELILGDLSLTGDPIRAMLTTDSYEPDPAHRTEADVWGQLAGKGYTAGGKLLASKSVDGGIFRAADLIWPNATLKDVARVVLYRPGDGALVCCLTLDEPTSSKNHDFTIQWADEGILDLRKALELTEEEMA